VSLTEPRVKRIGVLLGTFSRGQMVAAVNRLGSSPWHNGSDGEQRLAFNQTFTEAIVDRLLHSKKTHANGSEGYAFAPKPSTEDDDDAVSW